MDLTEKLNSLLKKYSLLEQELTKGAHNLGDDFVKISKEYAELTPIIALINKLNKLEGLKSESIQLLEEADEEIKTLAKEDLITINQDIEKTFNEIKLSLLPKNKDDSKNVILEIRAGTGGDEASLFTGDLFRMYQRFAERNKWKLEILSFSESGKGGYKEIVSQISGKMAFAKLKYESGIHRVQRIPDTEASGRVHTSATSVVVLPEALEVDIKINPSDLRIDVFRASGAGGQHVNTTDSAVRITHIPSGIAVSQQDEKSQHKNKAKAMKILMSRLYDKQKKEQEQERKDDRKIQVGSGDRSAKIRTYNFPQSRVTDHRITLTLYRLSSFLDGDLTEMINALTSDEQASKLSQI